MKSYPIWDKVDKELFLKIKKKICTIKKDIHYKIPRDLLKIIWQ